MQEASLRGFTGKEAGWVSQEAGRQQEVEDDISF